MSREIHSVRKWILFPDSRIGWFIAFLFVFSFIFPQYLLYGILIAVVLTFFLLLKSRNKTQEDKSHLYRLIFLIFFLAGIYLLLSESVGWGLLLWLIGFVIGVKGYLKYTSEETATSLSYITYNYAPILFIISPILFLGMFLVGIKENRIDVPIVGFVLGVLGILFGFWTRKKMKKELNHTS